MELDELLDDLVYAARDYDPNYSAEQYEEHLDKLRIIRNQIKKLFDDNNL